MDKRLNLVNWLMVITVAISIISHRMFLKDIEAGTISQGLTSFMQIIIMTTMLLFLLMMAGVAVFIWQKISAMQTNSNKEVNKFPKLSFLCGVSAFLLFSFYWTMLAK